LASSTSFERITDPRTQVPDTTVTLRGHARIPDRVRLHRSVNQLAFRKAGLVPGAILCLLTTIGWLSLLPTVCNVWRFFFDAGIDSLQLNASVFRQPFVFWHFRMQLPSIDMASTPPDRMTWWVTAVSCAALLAISYRLPPRYTPLAYLLRFAIVIQASALAYFFLIPARFPHAATEFITSTVAGGAILILFVPAIFSLIYYVFDFSMSRKALLTVLTMVHLAVFVPLQALLQAYILNRSVLFMPVLFLLFGMPLEILVIVSFYSWGMSWKIEEVNRQGT
jgi:hypothetical protein